MNVPGFRRTVGSTTPEVLASDVSSWADVVSFALSGRLELPSVDQTGNVSSGNLACTIATNTFTESDADVFFAHDLGVPTTMAIQLISSEPCTVYLSPKPPSSNGIYLRCKLGTSQSAKVSVLVWGRRAR